MPQRQLVSGKASGFFACAVKQLILGGDGVLGGVWGCKDRKVWPCGSKREKRGLSGEEFKRSGSWLLWEGAGEGFACAWEDKGS